MDNPGTCPASASIAFAAGLASSFCEPTLLTFPTSAVLRTRLLATVQILRSSPPMLQMLKNNVPLRHRSLVSGEP